MNLSPVTADSVVITLIYSILLLWGMWVGVRQVYQGFCKPKELLNPLFGNRQAIKIFTFHLIVVSLDLFVCGPVSLQYKSRLWYWGGRIALLSSSFPLASYFNRNPQSFGKLIGVWVRFRNFFEIGLHVLVASIALNWFNYYGLLYWIVAYRYLDVGPRRLFQTLLQHAGEEGRASVGAHTQLGGHHHDIYIDRSRHLPSQSDLRRAAG